MAQRILSIVMVVTMVMCVGRAGRSVSSATNNQLKISTTRGLNPYKPVKNFNPNVKAAQEV